MSQVLVDTDLDALAAEYVLGTLGADERTHAQALLVMDDGFAAKVRMWERRFGELHLMVEPVDPDLQIWARIKAKVPDTPQAPSTAAAEPAAAAKEETPAAPAETPAAAPVAVPAATEAVVIPPPVDGAAPAVASSEAAAPAAAAPSEATLPVAPTLPATAAVEPAPATPPEPAPATPPVPVPATLVPAAKPAPVTTAAAPFPSAPRAPLVVDDERAAAARRRAGRWRALAMLMTLVVMATGGLVAAWRFAPEHVPPMLQPVEALRAVGIAIETGPPPPPRRPPAPPESRYDE